MSGGDALLSRAHRLSGRTIAEVASSLAQLLPGEPRRHKGFVGKLIERALGSSAKPSDVSDFPALGIEVKTLPVDARGRSSQSTFVCHVDLARIADAEWSSSRVRRKLGRVLFVPIESAPAELGCRRVGRAFLWSPSPEQDALLRADFEDLVGRVGAGAVESLTGHHGHVLQVRPKAARASARRTAYDADGAPARAQPKAFYLRAGFTSALMRDALRF